ncbi:MAG: hypothetical protein IPK10_02905 [Bacteroidetes bacterium]|nr:hypothetical protein [Bacteroidota bacterium]
MKKLSLILLFTFLTYIVSAQEPFKNRDGLIITPEKGEMSLGFDAVPFLKFIGNLFNPGNNIPTTNFTASNPLTISSNYMLNDNMALRSKIRIGLGVNKTDTLVARVGSTNPNETVSNETKINTSNITLGSGLQKWRGKGRVRGYYGGEILFSIYTEKTTYTYGNALSSENQNTRNKSARPGNTFGFHLKGILGSNITSRPSRASVQNLAGDHKLKPVVEVK